MATVRSADGTTIDYDRVGTGPALVLVEGATAFRGASPFPGKVSELLSPSFTVYTYDRRGRGLSGDTAPYEVAKEIADLDAIIAEAGGTANVLGISSGAVLTLEAARSGSAISRLALYEPPFVVSDDRAPRSADYVARMQEWLAQGDRGSVAELFLVDAVGLPEEMVAGFRQSPEWSYMEAIAHTIPYDGAVMGTTMSGDPAQLQRFASVETPTLILYGGATEPWIVAAAHAITALLPNATSDVLPDQTHDVSPDLLAPAVAKFFS